MSPNLRVDATLETSVGQINADDVWTYAAPSGAMLDGSGMRMGIVDTGVNCPPAKRPAVLGGSGGGDSDTGSCDRCRFEAERCVNSLATCVPECPIIAVVMCKGAEGRYSAITALLAGAKAAAVIDTSWVNWCVHLTETLKLWRGVSNAALTQVL